MSKVGALVMFAALVVGVPWLFEVMPEIVPWFLSAMGAAGMIALVLMTTVGGMSLLPPRPNDGLDDGQKLAEDDKP